MNPLPAIHIAVYVGDATPTMFSTALKPSEQRMINEWLADHPELDALVREAWRLAEQEDEGK